MGFNLAQSYPVRRRFFRSKNSRARVRISVRNKYRYIMNGVNAAILVCVVVLCIITAMLLAMCYCAPEVGGGGQTPSISKKVLGGAGDDRSVKNLFNEINTLQTSFEKNVRTYGDVSKANVDAYNQASTLYKEALKSSPEEIERARVEALDTFNRTETAVNSLLSEQTIISTKTTMLRSIATNNIKYNRNHYSGYIYKCDEVADKVKNLSVQITQYRSVARVYYYAAVVAIEALKAHNATLELDAAVKKYNLSWTGWFFRPWSNNGIKQTAQKVIAAATKAVDDTNKISTIISDIGSASTEFMDVINQNNHCVDSASFYSGYATFIIDKIDNNKSLDGRIHGLQSYTLQLQPAQPAQPVQQPVLHVQQPVQQPQQPVLQPQQPVLQPVLLPVLPAQQPVLQPAQPAQPVQQPQQPVQAEISTGYNNLRPLLPSERLINYPRREYSRRGQEGLDKFNIVLDTGEIPPGAHSDYILQASSLDEINNMVRNLTNRPGPRMLYGLVVDHPGDKVALYKAIAIVLNMRPPAAIENQKADRAHAATGFLYSIVRFESGGFYVKSEGLIKPEFYNVN